jgi:hypothetical protein
MIGIVLSVVVARRCFAGVFDEKSFDLLDTQIYYLI